MSVVVDASVVIKWFVPEAGSDAASRLLAAEDRFEAPDLLFAELANAIWKKALRGQLTRAASQLLVGDIEKIAVDTTPCRALASDAHALGDRNGGDCAPRQPPDGCVPRAVSVSTKRRNVSGFGANVPRKNVAQTHLRRARSAGVTGAEGRIG
jgi:hypothetical protein